MTFREVWAIERNGRMDKGGYWMPVRCFFKESDAREYIKYEHADHNPLRVVKYIPQELCDNFDPTV